MYKRQVARLGTLDYATHLICMNILNLSFSFGDGFGVAASSLVGQSLGAKRPDLAKIYGKTGQRIACSISFLLCVIFLVFRYQFMGWFTNDPGVISLGGIIMCLVSGITFAQTSQVVISGCLRGAGDTRFVALVSMISITFVRPFLTWLLCFPMGYGLIAVSYTHLDVYKRQLLSMFPAVSSTQDVLKLPKGNFIIIQKGSPIVW